MAGPKQHYIPRSVLRGFLTHNSGRAEQVWVYKKDRAYPSAIEGVAAQRHYYSTPPVGDEDTLDGRITRYENRLGRLLGELRASASGSTVNAGIAAEVIAHLTPRSNHVRGMFIHGMNRFAASASKALMDANNVARLIGLDEHTPNDRFRKLFAEIMRGLPDRSAIEQLVLPPHVLERMLFIGVREGFGEFFSHQAPFIAALCERMFSSTEDNVIRAHREALEKSLIPEPRMDDLQALEWTIQNAPNEGAILPDCVAISLDHERQFSPYIFTGKDSAAVVLMPLSSGRMLVGRRGSAVSFEMDELNRAFAECSHEFFVSNGSNDTWAEFAKGIGAKSTDRMEQAVSSALETFAVPLFGEDGELLAEDLPPPRFSSFDVSFLGCVDQESSERISETIKYVVSQFSRFLPLERLDGITFATDYPTALRELDRGFAARSTLQTVDEATGVGLAQCPIVVRDGAKKARIVLRGDFAHALVSDDLQASAFALHVLVHELAEAAFIQKIDEAVPTFLLQPCPDAHIGDLYSGVHRAIVSYFNSRASAGFGADEMFDSGHEDIALAALERCQSQILGAKDQFGVYGDVGKLFGIALDAVGDVLSGLASVAGHRDGLRLPVLPEGSLLDAALRQRSLRLWFDQFHKDMNLIWCTSGTWTADLFFGQRKHVERLLWPFGIIPWAENGGTYVRVMLPDTPDGTQDAA